MTFIYSQSFKNQGITKTSREKQTAKRPPKTGLRLREQLFKWTTLAKSGPLNFPSEKGFPT